MLRYLLLCSLVFGSWRLANAQLPVSKHQLRFELAAPLQKGLGLAYEFRPKAGTGFEIQLNYRQFNRPSPDMFHGDRIVPYGEQRSDSIIIWSGKPLNNGQWSYIGENRPMEILPEWLSLNYGYAKIGYLYYLPWASTRWQFFLRPGLFAGLYQYYHVEDNTRVIRDITETTALNIQGAQRRDRKVYYEQTRSMRLEKHISYGITYDAGISRMLGRHFFLEARGMLSLNLNPAPEPDPAAPVRRLAAQASLLLGYQF